MTLLEFDNNGEYLSYIEGLVGRDITNIIKKHDSNYKFKVGNEWYDLYYGLVIGTTFSNGSCLVLSKGKENEDLTELHRRQFHSERIGRIFEKLADSYLQHIVVNNEQTKEIIKNLMEFIDGCDFIEKYSLNLYVVNKGKEKYCFIRTEDFVDGFHRYYIRVKKRIGDNESNLTSVSHQEKVHSLMSFLDFAYYSSRLKDTDSTLRELMNRINNK